MNRIETKTQLPGALILFILLIPSKKPFLISSNRHLIDQNGTDLF